MEPGREREKQQVAVETMCDLMQKQHGTKGLRVDLQIKNPSSNQEIWVDVTCIHPTCKSRIGPELKKINEEIILEDDRRRGMNNYGQKMKSDGYAARQQTRCNHKTYGPLLSIAKKQVQDGRIHCEPEF